MDPESCPGECDTCVIVDMCILNTPIESKNRTVQKLGRSSLVVTLPPGVYKKGQKVKVTKLRDSKTLIEAL